MGFSASCFASLLLISLALVSGISGEDAADDLSGLSQSSVACVEPGNCDPVDDTKAGGSAARRSLRELLESLVSGRSIEKRGKQDSRINGFSSAEKEAIVRIHNQLRQSVDPPASNMLEMSWSDELEKVANNYARSCNFAHNPNRNTQAKSFSSVGENIHAHSNSYDETGAVQAWFNEDKYYNYNSHSCSKVCGHYTQVVWAKSYKVGCGVKFCNPLRGVTFGSGYIIVCNYAPAGNYRGVRPYEEGTGKTKLLKPPGSDSGAGGDNTSSNNNNPTTRRPKTKKKKTKKPRKSKKNRTKKPKKSRSSRKSQKNCAAGTGNDDSAVKPTAPQEQPSEVKPQSLKRTCQRGRQQALELKSELQEELKNAQPGSSNWRSRVRRTCSRGSKSMEEMKKRLQESMNRWRLQQGR